MNNFNAPQIATKFYAVFDATPECDLSVSAGKITSHRDAIIEWNKSLNQTLRSISARDVAEIYETLRQKISTKEIGSFHISFQSDKTDEPQQDKHPLLRAVDFAAHSRRSVEAYSLKSASSRSERAKELGDTSNIFDRTPIIAYLFVDVENHQGHFGSKFLPLHEALEKAAVFEEDVERNLISPQELAKNPALLYTRFEQVVGEYQNRGMGGVRVDVPALMKWEMIADKALKGLSLKKLKATYDYYQSQDRSRNGINRVIQQEIQSICANNTALKSHLTFGAIMTETHCDIRVAHLVGGSRRYPANIDEAFAKAIAEQSSSDPSATRPEPSQPQPPNKGRDNV